VTESQELRCRMEYIEFSAGLLVVIGSVGLYISAYAVWWRALQVWSVPLHLRCRWWSAGGFAYAFGSVVLGGIALGLFSAGLALLPAIATGSGAATSKRATVGYITAGRGSEVFLTRS